MAKKRKAWYNKTNCVQTVASQYAVGNLTLQMAAGNMLVCPQGPPLMRESTKVETEGQEQ